MPGPAQPSHSRARAVGAVASVTSTSACRPDMLYVLQTLLERATVPGAVTAGQAWLIGMPRVPSSALLSSSRSTHASHTAPLYKAPSLGQAPRKTWAGRPRPEDAHLCVVMCGRKTAFGSEKWRLLSEADRHRPGSWPRHSGCDLVTWWEIPEFQVTYVTDECERVTCFLNDWHFAYKEWALSRLQCSGLASSHISQTALGPLVSRAGRSLAHLHRSTEVGSPVCWWLPGVFPGACHLVVSLRQDLNQQCSRWL